MRKPSTHITLDVEAAGSRLGEHGTLSLGACAVSRERLSFAEYARRGLVFYAELRPISLAFEIEAMRVGCSKLMCIEERRRRDPRYDPTHEAFDPALVLSFMNEYCESRDEALARFAAWIERVSAGRRVIGITDTVFFDGGHVHLCFGMHLNRLSPFGWSGLDLDSLYRGYAGRADANLRELGVPDTREHPHRADHDAVFLAHLAHELLYVRMGW